MTRERAEETRSRLLANHGIFTVGKDVTGEEEREICAFWNRLPHRTSYCDAIAGMAAMRDLPGEGSRAKRPFSGRGDK